MSCVVYRFYNADDVLLYVGSTGRWPRRMQEHQSNRPWWAEVATVTLEHHARLDTARRSESAAIDAEQPRYTLPPATSTGRSWQARRVLTAERHAAGEFCGLAPCVTCRLRRIDALYREKTGGDLRTDVRELRASGIGRDRTASAIHRRLGLRFDDAIQITTGMVERLEQAEEAA